MNKHKLVDARTVGDVPSAQTISDVINQQKNICDFILETEERVRILHNRIFGFPYEKERLETPETFGMIPEMNHITATINSSVNIIADIVDILNKQLD